MKKSIDQDLIDASDSLEHLVKMYDKLTIEEKVDVGARLKGICKNAEAMRTKIGDELKERTKHKEGTVLGDVFKAVIKLVSVERFKAKELKEANPKLHAEYCRTDTDERVNYEPR